MNTYRNLTTIANKQLHPMVKEPVKLWRVYYGNNKAAWYEHGNYGYCVAEITRLMNSGQGYHKELFKIKP